MLEKFTYTNHLGEVINFGESPYFASHTDLRDYKWTYDTGITRFDRDTVTKTLEVILVGTEEDANKAKDALYEIFEKDVLAMKKGTFQVGEYKMNAFVYGSKKTNYLTNKRLLIVELDVVTDTPQWKTEKTFSFTAETETDDIDYGRDYLAAVGYPYGYSYSQVEAEAYNDSFYACGFRLVIYGPVTNPAITIGGKVYKVDVAVAKGEYLEIVSDGKTKTITLHKSGNVKEDCFAKRYKPQSVFAKIETGVNLVTWDNTFGFDLTLLQERSEPKWTL